MELYQRSPDLPHPLINCPASTEGHRTPEALIAVVKYLGVTENPRYVKRDTSGDGVVDTFCNIFVWDFSRAMGAEIPHKFNGLWLSANRVCDWLAQEGLKYGWFETDVKTAMIYANTGRPVVAVYKAAGTGHVAVVTPTPPGADKPRIAQAGARNFYDEPITAGFGGLYPNHVKFYAHA